MQKELIAAIAEAEAAQKLQEMNKNIAAGVYKAQDSPPFNQ